MDTTWAVQGPTLDGTGLGQGLYPDMPMSGFSSLQQQDLDISNQETGMLSMNMEDGSSSFVYNFNAGSQGSAGASGNVNGNGNGSLGFGQPGPGGMN